METPLPQVQNNPTTITTRSQQTYDWYPTTVLQYSQQYDNKSTTFTTCLQSFSHNKSTTDSQQVD